MKIKLLFLLFISAVFNGYAQPANDLCGNAQPLTVGVGSCTSVLFTNVAATTIGNPPTPACWLPNTMSNTVWFSFSATKADIEISTNFTGTLADTQIAVFSGGCGALTQLACQEDINTATGLLHTDVILHGLTIGTTYYIAVDGKGNATGTFGVCVQETLPIGPPLLIQDCVGAQSMCGLGNIVVPDGTGGIGLSQEDPSCFGAPGERSSSWYSFTAASNGTLCFTILPNAPIDYDFAVYNTTASCPGTELACNWDPEDGTGETGLGCTDVTQCESCIPVVAGQSYTILVDRFTANSSSGFALNFAGTSASFASPNPTFTATSPCVGTATQFTNTTNGNFTYSWNFGDSTTSSLENPTHTYASAGTYNVRLLITAVPGGCQNAVTIPVTVNPLPTVDAGTASGSVCPGSCVTLGGSTNATGFVGPQSFSNNAGFAIPDGIATGVSSPITVTGLSPATISATSIASVCVNLTHTWDSDLDVFLRCPDGTQIELSTDNGNLGDNYTGTCFSPTAATPITGGAAPFGGSFTPEQSFNLLNGCTANGTWELFVVDDTGGDTGTINNWTITFNNNTPAFTWSPTTAMTNANTLTPTVCPAVTTVYTLSGNGTGGCIVTDTVTVTVAGGSTANITYAAASFCTSDTPKLVTLTGTGTFTGGTYTSTSGLTIDPVTGTITPATSTPGPYVITYTIPASGGCPPLTDTFAVAINAIPNAGGDGGTAICDSNLAVINLFGLITGEQAGGVWTRISGTGGAFNAGAGTFMPAAGATTSTFTYTLTGTAPCTNDTSLATITITTQPNAGNDGGTAICDSNLAVIDLFTLITGEQVGGVWTRTSGTGGTFNAGAGTFTPAAGATTSTFTYTLTGTAPCTNDTSLATITITAQPNAGGDGGTAICDSNLAVIDLFTLITGEQVGGVWTRTSGTGGTFNAGAGTFTPAAGATTSTFTYTLTGTAPCTNDTSLATITITAQPNAGTDGGTAICDSNLAVIDLFTLITGEQAGGVWTRTSGTGGTFNAGGGTFTPSAGATTSTFTYTLTGTAPCTNDTSLATITITAQPNAGTDGGTAICDSNLAVIDLFTLITGEQVGGVWTRTSGTGGTFNAGAGTFTPAAGATTSTFTYTLTGTAPCTNDTSLATITITAQPNAGTDGGTAICDSNLAVIDLFTLITGEQTGGTWTRTSGTGGTFNAGAGTFTPAAGATTSTFTYTLTGTAPCTNDTSLATITITAQSNAGTDGGTIVCDSNTIPTDLFTLITGEQTGGTWTRTSGTGGTFNAGAGTFTPAAGATTSTFTYTLTGTAPCINDTSLATVTVSPTLTPVITCGLTTTTSVQFNWAAVAGATGYAVSYQLNANPVVSVGLIGNVLTYTQNGLAPGDTVTFAMVPDGPFGTCFAPATQICTTLNCILPTVAIGYGGTPYCSTTIGAQNVSLTGTGAFTGGTYSSTGGLSINPITGTITPGTSTPGTYTITYTVPTITGCSVVTASTLVTITALPTATISYAGTPFCISNGAPQSVTLIGTGAYTGGTYSSTSGLSINVTTGAITPSASTVGTYTVTYTTPVNAGCAAVTATTLVTINPTTAPIINCGISTISSVEFNWTAVTGATGYNAFFSINSNPIVPIGPIGNILTWSINGLNSGDNVVFILAPSGGANTCFAQASQLCSANNCNPPTATISYAGTPYCTSITTPQNVTLNGTGTFTGGIYSSTTGLTINAATGAITPTTSNAGTYTVTYTIAAAPGCSPVTATTVVTIAPTPVLPILITTQPTCTVPTGTITITGLPGLTYSFDGLPYSSTLIYGGLAAGSTHTVTARNIFGCISLVATSTLNAQPVTPAVPVLIKIEPTCVLATGTITITGIPGMTYSFDNGPYLPILIYSGLAAGSTHTVTAQNATGCISLISTATLNAQPITPAAPILTATQPSCAAPTGTITVTAVAGMTYSFDGSLFTSTLVYGGLVGGSTHNVRAQNAAGCISLPTQNTLNAQPATPATPIITATQPTCTLSTGSITITAVTGLTYSFDSGPFNATLAYSGLPAGSLHTVTAKNSLGCISLPATITLNAQPITPVTTATPNLQTICSGNATAIALSSTAVGTTYSWTVVQTNVSGATAGSGNTIAQTLTATNIISGQAVYTITPVANGCTGMPVTVAITVNPRPIAFANPSLQTICSNETTNIQLTTNLSSEPSFNWTVNQIGASGATSGSGSTIIQTLTATGTIPGTVIYTITPIKNGCTGTPIVVPVTVNPRPLIIGLVATHICTGETLNIPILSNIPGTTFTWTVVQTNVNGASDGNGNTINHTLDLSGTNPGTAIYTITPTVNGCVGAKATLTITVNPLPEPTLVSGIICVDPDTETTTQSYLLDAGLSNANHDFKWYLNGVMITGAVDNTYEAQLPGTYTVVATNTNTGCISQPVSTTVDAAYLAKILLVTVTDAFTDNPTIAAIVTGGTGPYFYQLDNGALQTANVFEGLSSGTHTVSVTDVNGCTDLKQEVVIIDYPKFFTPNGDGYNDYWNIFQLSDQPSSKIFIFDRYGKFIKEISPRGKGWDGTYGGHQLPGTDYWFSVDYLENNISKTFKSHFSLKR